MSETPLYKEIAMSKELRFVPKPYPPAEKAEVGRTIRLDVPVHEKLMELTEEFGISGELIIEQALIQYLYEEPND